MKKKALIVFSILVVLVFAISSGAYAKYTNYKLGQDIKKVIELQDQKQETQVIKEYNDLLSKYKNSSEVYLSLSNYYSRKNKLDKAIDVVYSGLDKNKDNEVLINVLSKNIQNATLQEGYLVVTKGSKIVFGNDKVDIKAKNGTNISLKLNIDTSKIDTSKIGFTKLQVKERYTGTALNIGIEVLEFTGNTMGNSLIGGNMAFKDGWIYYKDPSSSSLYKMREDLSQKSQLDGDVNPTCINIKDNSLYFIDVKSDNYGSLVKTDLDGTNKQVIRENAGYVYILDDSIYYTEITGIYNGWPGVSLNKMNFKYQDVQKKIETNLGSVEVINSKFISSTNKNGTFISSGKEENLWGDANSSKNLSCVEVYKGELYGNTTTYDEGGTSGFGKLDVEHNTQNITIENVDTFNCVGKDVYYVKDDSIFVASIDGLNETSLMDITEESYKVALYNINNNIYIYSDGIKIVSKQNKEASVNTNISDISDEGIITICNNANKLILDIMGKRNSDEFQSGSMFYSGLEEPYLSKEKTKSELSKYFTQAYVNKFIESQFFSEKDGKLYFLVGNSGVGVSYTYTTIQDREGNGKVIQAVTNAIYEEDNTSADNANVKLKLEDGVWKIDSFHSILE